MDNDAMLKRARDVFDTEITGLTLAKEDLGESFCATITLMLATLEKGGKIIVSGVGKNLHIAEKMSATFASTGTVSIVMNPIQAMHGDLGMVAENDMLIALSCSGESDEVIKLIPAVKRLGIKVVSMVSNPESTLARLGDVVLNVAFGKEACPFGMAPTSSTTATMAMGDALAMVMIDARHFDKKSYALRHPAGAIGRALVLRVADIMRTGEHVALLKHGARVTDAIVAMTRAKSGSAVIVDDAGILRGIFTDGDLRRHLSEGRNILEEKVEDIMTREPKRVRNDALAIEVLRVFQQYKIDDLPVVDAENKLVGCVDIQDLPKMKVL